MSYVEFNPLRAGISTTPEESNFTSLKERLQPRFNLSEAIKSFVKHGGCGDYFKGKTAIPIKPLAAFANRHSNNEHCSIPLEFTDYLELVDFTERAIRDDKWGYISEISPPILERLEINKELWLDNNLHFEMMYHERFRKKHQKRRVA